MSTQTDQLIFMVNNLIDIVNLQQERIEKLEKSINLTEVGTMSKHSLEAVDFFLALRTDKNHE